MSFVARVLVILQFVAALSFAWGYPVRAQHAHGHGPYAGMQGREIKALSPEQIAELRAGRGMGLALAAELNGYPGPVHVLELAAALGLTPEQRARSEELFRSMQAEARDLGAVVILREAELDRLFLERRATAASVEAAVASAGEALAALRHTHLKYHLAMLDVLGPDQLRRYRELRGYAPGSSHLR